MKQLSILIPDDQTSMSTIACIIGTYQMFITANSYYEKLDKQSVFKVDLVSATDEKLLKNEFLTIKSNLTITKCPKNDLIIIPATLIRNYETATKNNKLLIDWIQVQYKQGAEIASMCAGSFMLASAGLLTGRVCSTHWALAESFKELFPNVNLQTDKLITDENGIYTNGGAYSFLHLLLYLVEKFYDRQTAIYCAKYFQIDLDRNQQSEFLIFNGHKNHIDEVVLEAQLYMEANYQDKISIEDLSVKFGLSRRNFDRRFIKATGLRPFDYLQRLKVEAAKKYFENSRKSVNEVMYDVGYNDTKAFREVFYRITGIAPTDYKEKYNSGN
ncbi:MULTISPECIES: GlxA family transcriptional regulator [unclassified Sphingobacterium]|uniref:GlxA family transcriptional regulator n=1 Tax=unclassified Sphingobacterium TaxID=2609468 RepID=UPI00104584F6|nr:MULTISPECIES: helix-turn-helix domain-containing protein [unclassified Sphingobacterium]MCS3557365.1 transcriptional regulator GlxA family with amidase domain [Sphingobacterium sp. JUb21]TCQ96664.1 transcriptional regulator GlxA family with amidase domain [Sphingobacterium sp. JUb20]